MDPRASIALSSNKPVLLSPNAALLHLDKLLVLDVQNPKYVTKMIPKAQRVNVDITLRNVPRTQPILLTCLSGQRSFLAAQQLIQKGYRSVYVLKGGVMAWQRAGYIIKPSNFPSS